MSAVAPPQTDLVIGDLTIDDVGVLPEVAMQVNSLAQRSDVSAAQIAGLIVRDPVLTSKLLRVVNSAAFGPVNPIQSIQHAIGYLGIKQLHALVISSALVDSFRFDHGIVDPRCIWEHSLGCGLGARALAGRVMGVEPDDAYLAGLLHDLGRIIFISKLPEAYSDVVSMCERGLLTLSEAERSRFLISHEEAGFLLGQAWTFPPQILAAIRWHHHPDQAAEWSGLAATIGYANSVCYEKRLRFGYDADDELASEQKEEAWRILSLMTSSERDEIDEIVAQAAEQAKQVAASMM